MPRDVSADEGFLCDKICHAPGNDKMDTLYYEGICLGELTETSLGQCVQADINNGHLRNKIQKINTL
jgi:hypothetical protein